MHDILAHYKQHQQEQQQQEMQLQGQAQLGMASQSGGYQLTVPRSAAANRAAAAIYNI